jgi:manganese/zinc/iron transport system permease protein
MSAIGSGWVPPWDWHRVVVEPYSTHLATYGWVLVMAVFVAVACALVGDFLVVRRLALVGDAISHAVLPGIAIAFLVMGSRHSSVMFAGALAAGVLTVVLIEFISERSQIKQDAAIGITFSTLFAIGVILITAYAHNIDLDADCVLYGEIGLVSLHPETVTMGGLGVPLPVVQMGVVAGLTAILAIIFWKELVLSAFDAGLAAALGFPPRRIHYATMAWLSLVVVSAFQSVGAILVIAMLILPGATAFLLSHRMGSLVGWSLLHAVLSSVVGLHLGIWLDCSIAGAMVIAGAGLFGLAWLFSPAQGIVPRLLRHQEVYERDDLVDLAAVSAQAPAHEQT